MGILIIYELPYVVSIRSVADRKSSLCINTKRNIRPECFRDSRIFLETVIIAGGGVTSGFYINGL